MLLAKELRARDFYMPNPIPIFNFKRNGVTEINKAGITWRSAAHTDLLLFSMCILRLAKFGEYIIIPDTVHPVVSNLNFVRIELYSVFNYFFRLCQAAVHNADIVQAKPILYVLQPSPATYI